LPSTLDHFENKYLSEVTDENDVDETYSQRFLNKMNCFLSMIRYGIRHEFNKSYWFRLVRVRYYVGTYGS
jgi:hypothetical protein